jgi:hypothetical protein
MFIMTMAHAFEVGDRADVQINGEAATLHWRDDLTLVINHTDARRIVMVDEGVDGLGRPVRTFTCADADDANAESRR